MQEMMGYQARLGGHPEVLAGLDQNLRRSEALAHAWACESPSVISLVCLSRGRPGRLAGMLRSVAETTTDLSRVEFVVGIDHDDPCAPEYLGMMTDATSVAAACRGLRIVRFTVGSLAHRNNLLARFAAGRLLMECADDIRFETAGWDNVLRLEAARFPDQVFLAWFSDGFSEDAVACHPCVSRGWVDKLGYLVPPQFDRGAFDLWLTQLVRPIGRAVYRGDVRVTHDNAWLNDAIADETTRRNETGFGRDRLELDMRVFTASAPLLRMDLAVLGAVLSNHPIASTEASPAVVVAGGGGEGAERCLPSTVSACHDAARALVSSGRAGEALNLYRAALARHRDDLSLLLEVGKLALEIGLPRDRRIYFGPYRDVARDAFQRVAAADPENVEAHLGLGTIQARLGDATAALSHLLITVNGLPEDPRAHYQLGVARRRLGKTSESREAFERAIALAPRHEDALRALSELEYECGNFAASVDAARKLTEANPENSRGWVALGNALHAAGRTGTALECHRIAVRREPGFLSFWKARNGPVGSIVGLQDALALAEQHSQVNARGGTSRVSLLYPLVTDLEAFGEAVQRIVDAAEAPETIEVIVALEQPGDAIGHDGLSTLRMLDSACPNVAALRVIETRVATSVQRLNLLGWLSSGQFLLWLEDGVSGKAGWDGALRSAVADPTSQCRMLRSVGSDAAPTICLTTAWTRTLGYCLNPGLIDITDRAHDWLADVANRAGNVRAIPAIFTAGSPSDDPGKAESCLIDGMNFRALERWREAEARRLREN